LIRLHPWLDAGAAAASYPQVVDVRLGWRDASVPVLVLVVGVAELAALGTSGWVAAAGLEAVAAALLVLRRTHPLFAVPASAVALMAIPLTGTEMEEAATPIVFYMLGIYSLGRYPSRRSGLVAAAVTLFLVLVDMWQANHSGDVTDVMFVLALAIPPFMFGRITRKLAEQSAQIARQAERIRQQAVRAERDRIARELHDEIAHSVSAMVVQTAAAQDLVTTSPDRALALLESVAETGRRTLAETGRLLHLVRDESDELGLHPAPGLADLPALLNEMRSAGLTVDASASPPEGPLPGGVDVSAYRIVQEALTNALRYGDGAACLVLDVHSDELRIECSNRIGQPSSTGSSLGLTGMAERVSLLGGTVRHGQTGDTYQVTVRIPLRTAVAP
jgi:signal transduction histidine kinase